MSNIRLCASLLVAMCGTVLAGDVVQVSKSERGEVFYEIGKIEPQPDKAVTFAYYRLFAMDLKAEPRKMLVSKFTGICSTKGGAPLMLLLHHTEILREEGGKMVHASEESFKPPRDIPLTEDKTFFLDPVTAVCLKTFSQKKTP